MGRSPIALAKHGATRPECLTFGLRPLPRWLLLAQSFNTVELDGAGPLSGRTRWHKVQLSAAYDLSERWSAQIGLLSSIPDVSAVPERGLVFGLWHRF